MIDENEYYLLAEPPPHVCNDCGAAFDPRDEGEIDAHRDEHWHEWLRAQCPIDHDLNMLRRLIEHHGYEHGLMIAGVRPWPPRETDDEEEVPF
ncbi:MAG TPA: hypothetical protein VF761_17190 [Gemmatimonadaceae bacterium]